ncbi:hypothetical protein BSF43_48820 [Pseudomonas ogarae]|uniref:hypothetical protein n=1 Tax=Pseudomonas ogarae (strain DSM 112162 / CECT 30235 / F113) TaxID=1114970 RepID=UPI001143748F|nr:hypothetical protein [Pseudomonas ogarae]PBJ02532.1 hypothetical protein BSF43_48820 [Pseudomonas ogarae]
MNASTRLICLICLLFCLPAYSNTAADPMLSYFDELLKICHTQLDGWRSSYRVQVGIAILVSVLGLVAAALQGSSASYVKGATVALGVVISAITIAVNTLEMNNYRQISISIDKVEKIVGKMETARLNYKTFKKPDNELAAEEFQKLYARYQAIIDPPDSTPTRHTGYQLKLLTSAYAGEAVPDWLTRLPDNPKNLYFVGVADSAQLFDAQAESIRTAKITAIQFLRETLQTSMNSTGPVDPLVDTLTRSADEVDNYITYDEKTELYRYYSLVRVNRFQAESNTRFLYLKNGIESPRASFESIIDVQRQDNDYAARRLRLQEQQIDQTSKMLSAQQYKKFSDARQARRTDAPQQAIPLLKEVLAQQPEFYLGWFNLALAYSGTEEELPARQAYIRAAALEPFQPARDSSIYNAYGHFLLDRHEYCESTKLLERALTLEPQNSVAQRNLEKARSEMLQGEIQCH